jgi:hypothetical protein
MPMIQKVPGTEDLSRFRRGGQMAGDRSSPQEDDKRSANVDRPFCAHW